MPDRDPPSTDGLQRAAAGKPEHPDPGGVAAPPSPPPRPESAEDVLAGIQRRLRSARAPLGQPNPWRAVYEQDVAVLLNALRGSGPLADMVRRRA